MIKYPDAIFAAANNLCIEMNIPSTDDSRNAIMAALMAERSLIVLRLLQEADLTPCAEDAIVTRSNAFLIQADFSYEDADALAEKYDAAPTLLPSVQEPS